MVEEIDTKKVKKGFILAMTQIPVSADIDVPSMDFTPKTITKITLIVSLAGGASMTVSIAGIYTFPVFGSVVYDLYSNEFTEDGIAEIVSGSFHKYDLNVMTDASTMGSIYAFFEYDYDLIK